MVPLISFHRSRHRPLYLGRFRGARFLSWLIAFNVVNTNNRFVYQVADMLYRLTEPALRPIRSILPNLGGIDISPVILYPVPCSSLRDVVLLGWVLPLFAPVRHLSELKLRHTNTGVILPVRLTPKSGRDEIVGIEDVRRRGGAEGARARGAGRRPRQRGAREAHCPLAEGSAIVRIGDARRQVALEARADRGRCGTLALLIEARLGELAG